MQLQLIARDFIVLYYILKFRNIQVDLFSCAIKYHQHQYDNDMTYGLANRNIKSLSICSSFEIQNVM
jgi:hypothetical protein